MSSFDLGTTLTTSHSAIVLSAGATQLVGNARGAADVWPVPASAAESAGVAVGVNC